MNVQKNTNYYIDLRDFKMVSLYCNGFYAGLPAKTTEDAIRLLNLIDTFMKNPLRKAFFIYEDLELQIDKTEKEYNRNLNIFNRLLFRRHKENTNSEKVDECGDVLTLSENDLNSDNIHVEIDNM